MRWAHFDAQAQYLVHSGLPLTSDPFRPQAILCAQALRLLSFCRVLEPRPESLQLDAPGHHFVGNWGRLESLQIDDPGYHFVDF